MRRFSQQAANSCRILQLIAQQSEKHRVLPLPVLQIRLALDALAHVTGALRLRDRALVEAVDLQLDPVQVEVDEQMALELAHGLVADPAAAEARMDREPPRLRDPAALVDEAEADRACTLAAGLD